MDAGANVHILYPSEYEKQMIPFIDQELSSFCKNKEYIVDQVGAGARKLD
jgi:diphosphomevalonate decarboxylase